MNPTTNRGRRPGAERERDFAEFYTGRVTLPLTEAQLAAFGRALAE